MHILATANAKGGTGKSTLAVTLATGLAKQGARTLLVDLDFQGNASEWLLGKRLPPDAPSVADVLETGEWGGDEVHEAPNRPGLFVLPSTPAIATAEYAVANAPAGETHLRRAFAEVAGRFDYVVMDCAPNLGRAVICGLCAADSVLVPVVPAFLSLTGIRDLETTLARLREGVRGVNAKVLGYLLFAADAREGVTEAMRELLATKTKGKLMDAQVRVSTLAKRLPESHLTAWDEGADARGAEDYPAVLAEVLQRIGTTTTKRKRAS